MPKVTLVTDSSACLTADLAARHGIVVVPLAFLFDGDLHFDGALSGREFYALLKSCRRFPTTTSPAPGAFLEAFHQARGDGADAALCITLPSRYSGTYSSAVNAAELARQEMPGFTVRVVDSGALAMCHGFAVLAAAHALDGGADLDEAAELAQAVGSQAHLIGVLDTTRYLAKSGRVPWIVHWAAAALSIKPVLSARGQEVKAIARARTLRAALDRLLLHLEQQAGAKGGLRVAVMHADALDTAQGLAERIRERWQPQELLITEFTSVMGIHSGPGFVGLAFYSEADVPDLRAQAVAVEGGAPAPDDDVRRLEASLGDLPPPQRPPALVVVSGLPGSGKSHFTGELCRRHPLAHLDSDALRRALFPQPTHSAGESARLFAACHELLDRLLGRGVPAVLDATNLREIHRRPLYRIAEKHGARLLLVRVKAPPALIRRRLERRARAGNPWDASAADVEVYERMRKTAEPLRRPHIAVDTSRDIEPALAAVLRELENATVGLPA